MILHFSFTCVHYAVITLTWTTFLSFFLIANFLIYLLWKSLSYIEDQKERPGNVAVTVESFHAGVYLGIPTTLHVGC